MVNKRRDPFNVKLLQLDKGQLRTLSKIDTLDTFASPSADDFHETGLFSTSIFGRVGDPQRDKTFAYIDLRTQILHPFIYKTLKDIRRFYIDIIEGERYAVFDDEQKDFVPAREDEGSTGYAFFMSHWHELEIPKGKSDIRRQRVELINKYREKAPLRQVLVMPAGLRDAEPKEDGSLEEDEINDHYRRLIGSSITIGDLLESNDAILDTARRSQQKNFNNVYNYIRNMLTDKGGFFQSKWGKRTVMHGTRNVITAMDISPSSLDDPSMPDPDRTVLGLYQLSKGAMPITLNRLRNSVLGDAFGASEGLSLLVNPDSLQSEYVRLDPTVYDEWTTIEGLEQLVNRQSVKGFRSQPVTIPDTEGREYYLALVYKPIDEKVFKIFQDINELPEYYDREDVYPITLMELIYLSNYWGWNNLSVQIVRYPVTGEESSYISKVFVRTTVNSERRVELDENWQRPEDEQSHTATVYPVFNPENYIDSTMVHPHRLGGLGGDYDGDTVSANVLISQEANSEIDRHLLTRQAHIDPSGGLRASAATDTTELVLFNMTGAVES